jgi:peptidoglycan/xylan/chitin deacetylase (PgdA/CDA1 family)
MISEIRKLISYALCNSGITTLLQKLGNNGVLILVYHRIINPKPGFLLDPGVVSAYVAEFKKQMEYLSRNYTVISLEQLLEFRKKKINPPQNSVIITFDDGYKDNYLNAFPILRKYGFPATIFITTDALEKKALFWWDRIAYAIQSTKKASLEMQPFGRYTLNNEPQKLMAIRFIQSQLKGMEERRKNQIIEMLFEVLAVKKPKQDYIRQHLLSWDEVLEMGRHKITFGSHTQSHPILTNLPLKDAESEIRQSKSILEIKLGKKITCFSYPNGYKQDFNKNLKSLLRQNGFECAVTYIPGWDTASSDLFELRRIFVWPDEDMCIFRNKLVGLDIIPARIYLFLAGIAVKQRV